MKTMLTRIALFTTLLLGSFFYGQATHYMGVDITYLCVNSCTYKITHAAYFDCCGSATSGALLPTGNPINPGSLTFSGLPLGCNPLPRQTGAWTLVSHTDVTPVCSSVTTNCVRGNSTPFCGVIGTVWEGTFNVCGAGSRPCTTFNIGWGSCCRNNVITSGAASSGMYTGNTTINLGISPCNSSPQFLSPPVSYVCLSASATQLQVLNQGAVDPDGDSLAYRLVPCLTGTGGSRVTYNAGFSATSPLGPTWTITLDPLTGDITFNPTPGSIQIGVICIEVQEWRNGNLIGTVVRDMQLQVIQTFCGDPPGFTADSTSLGGLPIQPLGTIFRGCVGAPLCFNIPIIPTDTSLDYTLSWVDFQNLQLRHAAVFSSCNGVLNPAQNSITSHGNSPPCLKFCFTPTRSGRFNFKLHVEDDNCPMNGASDRTITIIIDDALKLSAAATVALTGCNDVTFTALPRSTIISNYPPNYKYTWRGNGNLQVGSPGHPIYPNLDDSVIVHIYPRRGLYNYTLHIVDTFGCEFTHRGVFNLTSGAEVDAGPDLTICSGFNFQIGTPSIPGQLYTWVSNPAANISFLSNTTIADPVFSVPVGSAGQGYNYTVTATDGFCTAVDAITVTTNSNLSVSISPANPVICRGGTVTLTANSTPGATYLWSNGASTQSVTVSAQTAQTLSAVAFENGCTSPAAFRTVIVSPGPTGHIAGVPLVCPGESSILIASGGVSWEWDNGTTAATRIIPNITGPQQRWMIPYNTDGCAGDTIFVDLNANAAPVSGFASLQVCEGLPTQFNDLSSIASGSIVSWDWDFDNAGITSNLQSPSYTFTQAGTYNVTLKTTSDQGCEHEVTIPVTVDAIPLADFTFTNVCEGIASAFVDVTGGGAVATWNWTFADGNTGNGAQTTHLYNRPGFYNVLLNVSTANGCTDSVSKTVFVHPQPIADFDVISACQDSLVLAFNEAGVGGGLDKVNAWSWDFDDPGSATNTSNLEDPIHVYAQPGLNSIQLQVTTGNGCTHDTTIDVTVFASPVSAFTVTDRCENDITQFTSASSSNPATPIVRWQWNFGDGSAADSQDPKHRYRPSGEGTYQVTLKTTTSEGCTNTLTQDVIIHPAPEVKFVAPPVCVGDSFKFINHTTIPYTQLVGWTWEFGGSGQGANGIPEPAYLYDAAGEYTVKLTVVSDSGCSNIYTRIALVHELPPLSEITEDTVCFSNQAFLLTGVARNVDIRWYTDVNGTQPFHTGYSYVTPALAFTTTFFVESVSEFGCVSERQPVIATVRDKEELKINASNRVVELPLGVVEFEAASTIDLVSWSWDFADGTVSELEKPVHEFSDPGKYEVTLHTVDKNGCELDAKIIIEVRKVVGAFFPTAFTPNGDGHNDHYKIEGYNLRQFQISIFSRWGMKIYFSAQPDFRWDGKDMSGKDVPEGVYIYSAEFLDVNGKVAKKTATITLIR